VSRRAARETVEQESDLDRTVKPSTRDELGAVAEEIKMDNPVAICDVPPRR
jgi:hypothetical protein